MLNLLPYYFKWSNGWYWLYAYVEDFPSEIGYIQWADEFDITEPGEVAYIWTHENYRRQGVATRLWIEARRRADNGDCNQPIHSDIRNTAGDLWAQSLGGDLILRNSKSDLIYPHFEDLGI